MHQRISPPGTLPLFIINPVSRGGKLCCRRRCHVSVPMRREVWTSFVQSDVFTS